MGSILKMVHLTSVNDTFKVVRFLGNGVLKCRYLDSIQMAGTHMVNVEVVDFVGSLFFVYHFEYCLYCN